MIEFADIFKEYQEIRKQEKLTYKQIGERANLSTETVYNIMNMKYGSLKNMLKIEGVFKKLK